MSFQGMDTDRARDHAGVLEDAARRLEDLLDGMEGTVAGVAWEGPDAETFRADWAQVRTRGEALVLPDLRSRSRELQEHADEQDGTSEVEGAGFWDGVLDWLGDLGGSIRDGVEGAAGWIGDRLGDVGDWFSARAEDAKGWFDGATDWVGDRLGDAGAWLGDAGRWIGDRAGDVTDWAVDGLRSLPWPRFTEVLVGGVHGIVEGAGHVAEFFGIENHWGRDGSGYADAPQAVGADAGGFVPPDSLAAIIANTNATYGDADSGQVSMSVVGHPPEGVVVNIPGTQNWSIDAGDNPMDLTGNAELAGGGDSSAGTQATADAIAQLYADQGIPEGTPLLLSGHSQGGMIAAALAADPSFTDRFPVTNVLTYGSPVDNTAVPDSVHQLNIQHGADLVPRIDLEGAYAVPGVGAVPNIGELLANQNIGAGSTATVTLDSPAAWYDPAGNHSHQAYQESVAAQLLDPDSTLSQYSQHPSLDPFLSGDPDDVQHFTADVHRDHG